MAYSIDLRKRVIGFINDGHSKEKAAKVFRVSTWCIYDWIKRDDLTPKQRPIGHNRKYDWDILAKTVENNPDRTILEYAQMRVDQQFKMH